ncbi:MAG TPA: MoaD/ThiS family protein, partial [Vicinamibacteria bacterium]
AALAALFTLHAGLRDRILNERGELRPHVNVFVGSENVRDLNGLATRLPEGAELFILPAVSGG